MTTPKHELPGGGFLAYTVAAESYYWRHMNRMTEPNIGISASHDGRGGGVDWEFSVADHTERLGQQALRVEIFDDAWQAFAELPEIFTAMGAGEIKTLDDLRALLDRLGAVDQTTRTDPYGNEVKPLDVSEAAQVLSKSRVTPEQYARLTDQPYRSA